MRSSFWRADFFSDRGKTTANTAVFERILTKSRRKYAAKNRLEFNSLHPELRKIEPQSVEGKKALQLGVDKLEQAYDLFTRGIERSAENLRRMENTEEGKTKYELREDTRGNQVVLITDNILKGVKTGVHQAIADNIADHIGDYYTLIESGQKVYIGDDLPGEYTYSKIYG